MPLDLSLSVDKEVFDLIEGFGSGVEAKNFLCSAILYYARSPLVLSANALVDSLDRVNLDDKFRQVFDRLDSLLVKLDRPMVVEKEIEESEYEERTFPCGNGVGSFSIKKDNSKLGSLREKFKI